MRFTDAVRPSAPDAAVCAVLTVRCVAPSPDRSEPPLATDALLGLRSPSLDALASFFLASAAALFVPVVVKFFGMGQGVPGGPITFEGKVQMLGFLVFEAMVGIFWPSMMKMRSQYVPEEVRSTVMNFFRIPLNLFVCVILYNVAMFPLSAMFAMCTLFLLGAAFLQKKLEQLSNERPHGKYVQMTDRA